MSFSKSSKRMVPLSAFCKKLMQRSSVVLPEPLLPKIEMTSPLLTVMSTPFITWVVP